MYRERINHRVIENSIENQYVTIILGPRRVGKTTFISHYAQNYPDRLWVFFNMDKMEQRTKIKAQQLETMIIETAKQHISDGKKIWVIIDEAQKCPEIFDQIKIIYDTYKDTDSIKFILTGSAVLSLHQFTAESLAGRVNLHHLQEFNLREALLLKEKNLPLDSILDTLDTEPLLISDKIHKFLPFKSLLEQTLQEILIWGGLPEVILLKSITEKVAYLNNYLQTYLEKDVRAIETITDLPLYQKILEIIAEQTGSLRDDQRIIQSLGCTRDTLKKYRSYVEATLLFKEIYPYIDSNLKRLVKSPKGFLLNNGLISLLTGINDLKLLEKTGLIGHRLENWFLNELRTWVERSPLRQHIYYWRTSSGAEVDFIVVRKPNIYPFEVTYNNNIENKKIRNLTNFMQLEKHASWGFYVYRGDFKVDNNNRIIFLPAWAIA